MLQPKKQNLKATKDSTEYFLGKAIDKYESIEKKSSGEPIHNKDKKSLNEINENRERQKRKGKQGYDTNGFPLKKSSAVQNAKDFVGNKKNKSLCHTL